MAQAFFSNQQFITWGTVADSGSCNVTTYMGTDEKREEKKGERKRKGKLATMKQNKLLC